MIYARPDYKRPGTDAHPAVACATLDEVSQAMVNSISSELEDDDTYFEWCKKRNHDLMKYSSYYSYTYCESYMEIPAIEAKLLKVSDGSVKELKSYKLVEEAFKKAADNMGWRSNDSDSEDDSDDD